MSLARVPRDRIAETISGIEGAGGDHLVPVLEALRDHGADLVLVFQRCRPFEMPRGPAVALVGDDPGPPADAAGPAGFPAPSMRRLLGDASGVIIVAGAPDPQFYAAAALAARSSGRVAVLIETRLSREPEWLAFAQAATRAPILVATERGGAA